MLLIVIWTELYLLLNMPKRQSKQYPVCVAVAVDEADTLKYSNYAYVLVLDVYELI